MFGQDNDRIYCEWMSALDFPESRAKQFDVIDKERLTAIGKIDREKERRP